MLNLQKISGSMLFIVSLIHALVLLNYVISEDIMLIGSHVRHLV